MGGTLKVLGAVRFLSDDRTALQLRSIAHRRLLSILAAAGGDTVRAEALCETLALAPSALRTSLSRLRARIGDDVIITDDSGYRLAVPIDATEFERLTTTPAPPNQRLANLDAALELWHGDAFEEFRHEEWAEATAARLDELRLVAAEDRAELLIGLNRSGEAVAELSTLVDQQLHRDRPRGLLMQALASNGRQAEALRVFQDYRSFLNEESGLEPSAQVQAIEHRIISGESDERLEAMRNAHRSGLVVAEGPGPANPPTAAAPSGAIDTTLPSGVLAFMFTDIEASTRRWETMPDAMRAALEQHDNLVHSAVAESHGTVFKHTGDGVGAVFTSPNDAVKAAIAAQTAIQTADWPFEDRLKIRIGLHVGDAEPTRGDYFGAPVSRASRIMDIANGDQILVSSTLASFVHDVELRPMGEHQLKGIGTESIKMVLDASFTTDHRPLRSRVKKARHLPAQPHRLIGREVEVAEITELVEAKRAITIVGAGGVGKTRLAIAVAETFGEAYPDGVVLCELSDLGDGDALVDAVAEAIGARSQPDMTLTESITNYLEDRSMLLILDNCEHVSNAARDLSDEILRLDNCAILATSREPLGVAGERIFGLSPLKATSDGVELFCERAAERMHSFVPTEEDLDGIRQICVRLDGIPLAIELAAAWMRVLTPAQLVERLHDRFKVLRGGRSGGRHETLRDTVLWSYEQLDPAQATLFNRLSVFAGGFSLDAVEAVCTDIDIEPANVLETIMALVDKSMVTSIRGVGHIRFNMLSTIRQFGQEQLDASADSELYRRRHAEYFHALAETASALLISRDEAEVWAMHDREWANLRAAFETFLVDDDADKATSFVLELGWFSILAKRFELFAWIDEVFEAFDVTALTDAGSLYGLRAMSAYFQVDSSATDFANRGLELDPADRYGFCRQALASVSLNNELSGEVSARLTSDWIHHLNDDSPAVSRMWALGMRTFHICANEPSEEAQVHADALAELATETGSATATGLSHWASGMVATFGGIDDAIADWRQGIDSVQSLDPVHLVSDLIVGLILHFTVSRGDLDVAIDGSLAALQDANEQHYKAGASHLFGVAAIVLCRTDRSDIGAKLLSSMVTNGHQPRDNAVRAVQRAHPDGAGAIHILDAPLTIGEAAAIATAALTEARDERTATND